jgi:hypothetical protein
MALPSRYRRELPIAVASILVPLAAIAAGAVLQPAWRLPTDESQAASPTTTSTGAPPVASPDR